MVRLLLAHDESSHFEEDDAGYFKDFMDEFPRWFQGWDIEAAKEGKLNILNAIIVHPEVKITCHCETSLLSYLIIWVKGIPELLDSLKLLLKSPKEIGMSHFMYQFKHPLHSLMRKGIPELVKLLLERSDFKWEYSYLSEGQRRSWNTNKNLSLMNPFECYKTLSMDKRCDVNYRVKDSILYKISCQDSRPYRYVLLLLQLGAKAFDSPYHVELSTYARVRCRNQELSLLILHVCNMIALSTALDVSRLSNRATISKLPKEMLRLVHVMCRPKV